MLPAPDPHRALFIPEILEAILLQLVGEYRIGRKYFYGEHTILLSQRVCRYWNDVIKSSSEIQTALYFKPKSFKSDDPDPSHESSQMIQSIIWHQIYKYYYLNMPHKESKARDNTPVLDKRQDAFMRKEASWRRMLVHQPPCPNVMRFLKELVLGASAFSEAKFDGADEFLRLGNFVTVILEGKITLGVWDLLIYADIKVLYRLYKCGSLIWKAEW
ncbi:hypothetical protein P170DRAFT_507320 [Aspergillus steynii IBT 23096]|uniref:F-box domain-containing protein n=1 Tax=Aspergillus steynii IBT 23096 TaxID=1392250 RepID=A0A2I2GI87_9EURO|nr:uncharacterized protein P170DRAFT_507320 [Aspergillus steynii IBT 23096]PLB52557.1 hypothetical protein P170DRAFT_507320 [Aspergillus steynii IBT 23096]